MSYTPATEQLIQALQSLPGVGTRSAQRMALHLLERDPQAGDTLAASLKEAIDRVHKCPKCRSLTEADVCEICSDDSRDAKTLCLVASDADKAGIEMAAQFQGRYFVLHGTLSPIDGVGPNELGLLDLAEKVKQDGIQELIIALDDQLESEATVHYITEQYKNSDVTLSRVHFHQLKSGKLDQVESRVIENALSNKQTIGFEHD